MEWKRQEMAMGGVEVEIVRQDMMMSIMLPVRGGEEASAGEAVILIVILNLHLLHYDRHSCDLTVLRRCEVRATALVS